jgi:DNA modification methylase
LGDIIYLGKHILVCGDSTKLETLHKFPSRERVVMVYSDPIYNLKGGVSYRGGVGGKKDYGADVNDTRSFGEYMKFIEDSLKAVLSISDKDVHVFYWCDQIYIGLIQEVFRKNGLDNKRVCLWIKNGQNPVPGVAFNKCYEPCVYATLGKPYLAENQTKNNEILNSELTTGNEMFEVVDLWLSKRIAGQKIEHATSKPISLAEKSIKRCTKVGDIIFDSFLGSGSTLLCAEQLGRVVYGCELEPVFCDLIVKRWELLTGKKAIYENQSQN